MFRVSKMTIYRMINTSQITALRLGKFFRNPPHPADHPDMIADPHEPPTRSPYRATIEAVPPG